MFAISDRVDDFNSLPTSLPSFNQLVDRRLAIAAKGLAQLREYLAAGQEDDAEMVLGKLNEDLYLLRRRLRREGETVTTSASTLYDCVTAVSQSN
ncbi:MAG TPA: hypothetical protein VN688_06595 [Gemmataceae bacterium]|nr:hypothetical protein [Gemmataceae bacterium]